MLTETGTMITPENYNGIVRQLQLIQRIQYFSYLCIHKGNRSKISPDCLLALSFIQPKKMRLCRNSCFRYITHVFLLNRQSNGLKWVHVKIFPGSNKWMVRPEKSNCQKKGIVFVLSH